MKYKGYSDSLRRLFEDEALADLPPLQTAEGQSQPWEECGDCFTRLTLHATKEEYYAYLRDVEAAGWTPCIVHPQPLVNVLYKNAYRKDRRLLMLTYCDFNGVTLPRKLIATVGLMPAYRCITADEELFRGVPVSPELPARDCGEGNFIKTVENAGREDYDALCAALERDGWQRRADNGAGLAGAVFTRLYTRDRRTLCALYTAPSRRLYVTVGEEETPLSPHLQDDPAFRAGFAPGAKTSLHMLELWHFGNSFVIRLKNGHFLVSDGGLRCETPYLLDYLDSLTPAGETPVVEGWFISHEHADHCGVLLELAQDESWGDRLRIDGIYFSTPSVEMLQLDTIALGVVDLVRLVSRNVRTSSGGPVPFYRPRTGERYYFADLTVDVLHAQEILPYAECSGDFNDTGTWLLVTVEGQKVLLGGDGDKGGMKRIMENYTSDFMTLDVMTLLHHGWNTRDYFTDFCHVKTMLFTCLKDVPPSKYQQNEYLKTQVEEWFPWGEGTRVLTFPYRVGESVCLPHFDWKYHRGETRPGGVPNELESYRKEREAKKKQKDSALR
ncbi:MAG: MBL fold metallo-hydrolase [Oscillospiraceae bacterium]|nr:MBL fold metallo-hydrolase [Oscillospiraceae bacterium]